jgi:hypothetical protein
MKFRDFLEITDTHKLPPIPSEMIRLTHFTSERIVQRMVTRKQPFVYKKQGDIDFTTDSFSSNDEIWSLIQKGGFGNFDRKKFGNVVLLIDMPYDDHRMHRNLLSSPLYVQNYQIVGYVRRDDLEFIPNTNYNPSAAKPAVERKNKIDGYGAVRPGQVDFVPQKVDPIPQPSVTTTNSSDIW